MGNGARHAEPFSKDDLTISNASELLGDEDNNMQVVNHETEGAGVNLIGADMGEFHQGNCSNERISVFEDALPLQCKDTLRTRY